MSSNLIQRIRWTIARNLGRNADIIAMAIVKEVETTHKIVDPEVVTEEMLDACFGALPKHYDPPDPKRRSWHGYKARHRYTAMVRAAKSVLAKGEST